MSRHVCHAHGCTTSVPPSMFMCRRHWYSVPKPLRDAIWREYQRGQENTKTPTARYMAVQRRAVAVQAFKPHDEKAALVCANYLLSSENWRAKAIARGEGDPLEGIDPPSWLAPLLRAELPEKK